MRVFFDQNVPRNLLRYLEDYEVKRAYELGWGEVENGQLLTLAETTGFAVFLTADQKLKYQQNLSGRLISIVELTANNWPRVEPHIHEIRVALAACSPGSYSIVHCLHLQRGPKLVRKQQE